MTDETTDLERFFRQIVLNLAATDPARLHRTLSLMDLRDAIVPYRANRRALQLESSEEYELLLMRLCAGEGGFARTEPENVRSLFAAELQSTNPDLGTIHLHESAEVSLQPELLARALDPKAEMAFAPPEHLANPVTQENSPPSRRRRDDKAPQCTHCGSLLPTYRLVKFCPHCGGGRSPSRCFSCENEIESGWRYCVSCGAAVW